MKFYTAFVVVLVMHVVACVALNSSLTLSEFLTYLPLWLALVFAWVVYLDPEKSKWRRWANAVFIGAMGWAIALNALLITQG